MRAAWLILAAFFAACQPGGKLTRIGDTIPAPLTSQDGNTENGARIFLDRETGHCVLCHRVDGLDAEFQGNLGPDLSRVGDRLSAAQLRLRLVDYDAVKPNTPMPSYFRTQDLRQVAPAYKDKTVLSAQDIEDLIAYLSGLTGDET